MDNETLFSIIDKQQKERAAEQEAELVAEILKNMEITWAWVREIDRGTHG